MKNTALKTFESNFETFNNVFIHINNVETIMLQAKDFALTLCESYIAFTIKDSTQLDIDICFDFDNYTFKKTEINVNTANMKIANIYFTIN